MDPTLNKPGYLTTEFYVTIATSIGALLAATAGSLPPSWAAKVAMVSAGAYAVSRAIGKVGPAIFTVLSALNLLRDDVARSAVLAAGSSSPTAPTPSTSPAAVAKVLIASLLIGSISLSGCSNLTPDQKAKVTATGSYVVQKAASIALQTVVSAAVNQSDANAKGNYLDSFANGLRTNAVASISSDDIHAIAQIWTPADKPHWTDLADSIAQLFVNTRGVPEEQRIELIAQGLNDAAAKARSMGTSS